MDQRENFAGPEETLRAAMRGMRAGLWTALPAYVVSYDPASVTAVLQPTIKGVLQKPDGSYEAVNLPLLPDVPVVFPRGGGATLTFPVSAGDECLVVFSSRCIDAWWQSGGIQLPMEPRMHDLSDGFAILGPQSQAKKIANISTTAVQLRSDDGQAYVQLNPSTHRVDTITPGDVTVQAGGSATVTASGGITLNGTVTINGDLSISGSTSGQSASFSDDVTASGKSLKSHFHIAQGPTSPTTTPKP